MRGGVITLAVGIVMGGGWAAAAPVKIAGVELERAVVKLYERCELTIRLDGEPIKNPYDDDEVTVSATFQPPKGKPVTVEGFFYQPFERVREGGRDTLTAMGPPVWKVRFTPRRIGRWRSTVTLRTPQGTSAAPGGTFEVIHSSKPGFLQIDPTTAFFRFEQGSTFIPIGENLAWGPSTQPLAAYERWFQKLSKQGANYIRVWLAPWSLRLETTETGVGRYDQQRAWQLDYLLEQSEHVGLYWQLCLLDHGSFSQTQDPEWHRNPYNEALGGMCRLPNEFVTHPEAKAMFRRLLRYLVSRWGSSPNLASWELFNEANYSDITQQDLTPWIEEMSAFLRAIDVNHHPITISFHQTSPEAVWRLPTIETIQWHEYDQRDFPALFLGPTIPVQRRIFQKPVLIGEFGWINEFMRRIDRHGIHVHDGMWSSVVSGAMGSALPWYWDTYLEPNELERHFGPLVRFWREEQVDRPLERITLSVSDADVTGASIGTGARAFLWLKNRRHHLDAYLAYRCEVAKQRLRAARGQPIQSVTYPARIVRGASVTLRGLRWVGRYRVEWWDPYQGRVVARSVQQARWGGTLTVKVPDLAFDVAAKIVRLNWWERG